MAYIKCVPSVGTSNNSDTVWGFIQASNSSITAYLYNGSTNTTSQVMNPSTVTGSQIAVTLSGSAPYITVRAVTAGTYRILASTNVSSVEVDAGDTIYTFSDTSQILPCIYKID